MEHDTMIVRRPNDRVRPICSCGWLGTTCRNLADAEAEAEHHKFGAAMETLLAETR